MRTFVALAVFTLLALSQVSAGQSSAYTGMTAPLVPLSSVNMDKTPFMNCKPYFSYTGDAKETGKVGLLTVVAGKMANSNQDYAILPWGTDKFRIRLDNNLKVPMIKVLRMGGSIYPWAEILISEKDFKQATACLSRVQLSV